MNHRKGMEGSYTSMSKPDDKGDWIDSDVIAKQTTEFLTKRGKIKRLAKGKSSLTTEKLKAKIFGKDYKSTSKKEYDSRVEKEKRDKGS